MERIQFHLNYRKALQACAELLRLETARQMSRLRLLKLLYLADREALRECGRPITGDVAVAMRHGPVLSRLYDIIKGEDILSPDFEKYVTAQGYLLVLTTDPGNGALNRFEVRKLREVWQRYREVGEWDLVEETHRLPEWIRNDPGDSSRLIPVEHILAGLGLPKARVDAIRRDAQTVRALREVFEES